MEGASLDACSLMSAKDIEAEDRWTLLPLSQEAQHISVTPTATNLNKSWSTLLVAAQNDFTISFHSVL
jgi:hypothetical protein